MSSPTSNLTPTDAGSKGGTQRIFNKAMDAGKNPDANILEKLKQAGLTVEAATERWKYMRGNKIVFPPRGDKRKHDQEDTASLSSSKQKQPSKSKNITIKQEKEKEKEKDIAAPLPKRLKTLPKPEYFAIATPTPSFIPNSIQANQIWLNSDLVTLPITLQTDQGRSISISVDYAPSTQAVRFFEKLKQWVEAQNAFMNNETFGAELPSNFDSSDLKQAMWSSILEVSGRLRYEPRKTMVFKNKAPYRRYLDQIIAGAQVLKGSLNDDLLHASAATPVTEKTALVKLLNQTDQSPVMTNEEHNQLQMFQSQALFETVEPIRRELVTYGVVVSKQLDDLVIKASEVTCVIAYFLATAQKFCPTAFGQPLQAQAQTQAAAAATVSQASQLPQATKPASRDAGTQIQQPIQLPKIMVEKCLEAHLCACAKCQPEYLQSLKKEVLGEAAKEYEASITDQVRKDITFRARNNYLNTWTRQGEEKAHEQLRSECMERVEKDKLQELLSQARAGIQATLDSKNAKIVKLENALGDLRTKARADVQASLDAQAAKIAKLEKALAGALGP